MNDQIVFVNLVMHISRKDIFRAMLIRESTVQSSLKRLKTSRMLCMVKNYEGKQIQVNIFIKSSASHKCKSETYDKVQTRIVKKENRVVSFWL